MQLISLSTAWPLSNQTDAIHATRASLPPFLLQHIYPSTWPFTSGMIVKPGESAGGETTYYDKPRPSTLVKKHRPIASEDSLWATTQVPLEQLHVIRLTHRKAGIRNQQSFSVGEMTCGAWRIPVDSSAYGVRIQVWCMVTGIVGPSVKSGLDHIGVCGLIHC